MLDEKCNKSEKKKNATDDILRRELHSLQHFLETKRLRDTRSVFVTSFMDTKILLAPEWLIGRMRQASIIPYTFGLELVIALKYSFVIQHF